MNYLLRALQYLQYSIAVSLFALLMVSCGAPHKKPVAKPQFMLKVYISKQVLILTYPDGRKKSYPVSTAARGAGQADGSLQTPLGRHVIIDKVGDDLPWNAIFKYGEFTGKYYSEKTYTDLKDPILSRVIRIAGIEPGYNSGAGVDTEDRRIYIHGTPPSQHPEDGVPKSRGCIRMSGKDMIDLYRRVPVGTEVEIVK